MPRTINGLIEDDRGNRVEVGFFRSEEEARYALDSLVDCENCLNCVDCVACRGCTASRDLLDCTGCVDCTMLRGVQNMTAAIGLPGDPQFPGWLGRDGLNRRRGERELRLLWYPGMAPHFPDPAVSLAGYLENEVA